MLQVTSISLLLRLLARSDVSARLRWMSDFSLPPHVATRRRDGRHEVLLHRSMSVIGDSKIEIKSARSTVIIPVFFFTLAVIAGLVLAVQNDSLPLWSMVVLLLFCLSAAPISVIALIGATVGADVVIDASKNSVTFQQGYLGMGIGTNELVPFERIDHLEVEVDGDQPDRWKGTTDSFRQFALILEKDNGKRLRLCNVPVPRAAQNDGMDRTLAVGNAVAAVTGSEIRIPEDWTLVEIDTDTGEITGDAT